MMKWITYLVCCTVLITACSKKEDDVDISYEPVIGFNSLSHTEVENFNNSITLNISYSDNNGDIGFEDPDTYALWVKDSRLDSADWYHIPPLAPLGHEIKIDGNLNIVLNRMFILGNGNEETVSLAVKLRDRANNWSDVIYTPTIKIKKI